LAEAFVLSESDRDSLKRILAEDARRRRSTSGRPNVVQDEPPAPEGYVALTPPGGIPSLVESSDVGTALGEGDVPGYADCSIFQLRDNGGLNRLLGTGITKRVHNLSTSVISGDTWILTTRDKFGRWYAVPLVPGGATASDGGTGTGTGTGTGIPDFGFIYEFDIQCVAGILYVYKRKVNLSLNSSHTKVTKSVNAWEYSHTAGCCECPIDTGTGTGTAPDTGTGTEPPPLLTGCCPDDPIPVHLCGTFSGGNPCLTDGTWLFTGHQSIADVTGEITTEWTSEIISNNCTFECSNTASLTCLTDRYGNIIGWSAHSATSGVGCCFTSSATVVSVECNPFRATVEYGLAGDGCGSGTTTLTLVPLSNGCGGGGPEGDTGTGGTGTGTGGGVSLIECCNGVVLPTTLHLALSGVCGYMLTAVTLTWNGTAWTGNGAIEGQSSTTLEWFFKCSPAGGEPNDGGWNLTLRCDGNIAADNDQPMDPLSCSPLSVGGTLTTTLNNTDCCYSATIAWSLTE
jgi:hypothetical protein